MYIVVGLCWPLAIHVRSFLFLYMIVAVPTKKFKLSRYIEYVEERNSETGCVNMDGGGCIRNKNNTIVKGKVWEKNKFL